MPRDLKLLISTRDPGGAQSVLPVIREALRTPRLAVSVVAQSPGFELLAAQGIRARRVACRPLPGLRDSARAALFAEARRILRRERPDAVLTSLSGPGLGIDEALVAESPSGLVYSVQDSEGYVAPGFGRPAPVYFVASVWAARATRRWEGIDPVVVGSLKHVHYAGIAPLRLRREARRVLPEGRPLIGFYGQPAWGLAGYPRAIRGLAAAAAEAIPGAALFYRPHPKESEQERGRTLALFSREGVAACLDPNRSVEASLCAADIVTTCYSTCGVDQIFLQRRSRGPLGAVLFVMTEPDIREIYASECGSPVPWQVGEGLAYAATRPGTVGALLKLCARGATARRAHRLARQRLPPAESAPRAVLRRILGDLAGTGAR